MKNMIRLMICIAAMTAVTGCGKNSSASRSGNRPVGVNDVLATGMAEMDNKKEPNSQTITPTADIAENERQKGINENAPEPERPDNTETTVDTTEGIDVDLTSLSSTMVYSEVYNMIVSPENYLGKIIKMNGTFAFYHDETTDKYYFACIIADATACCSQGIEFVLTDDYTYPDDYPEAGEEICVAGVYDTYQEGEYTYCTLRNAKIISSYNR